jgi:hypothetical protein
MDDAFMPLHRLLERMLPASADLVDEERGVRSYLTSCHIETPVEFDVVVDTDGTMQIGSTPPIYYVDTSVRPSFHHLTFTAYRTEDSDGR